MDHHRSVEPSERNVLMPRPFRLPLVMTGWAAAALCSLALAAPVAAGDNAQHAGLGNQAPAERLTDVSVGGESGSYSAGITITSTRQASPGTGRTVVRRATVPVRARTTRT